MAKYDIQVEILRHPEEKDWERCYMLALNTMGKKYVDGAVTTPWKSRMLKCKHSPIRTLVFTIKMIIPYYVSTHFVRHKIGVEHYVQSQRNDRQTNYDRNAAPQDSMVSHIMEINAEQLMFMANRRLCGMADPTTRYVMSLICRAVEGTNGEFIGYLKPMCEYLHMCPEFKPCGHWQKFCEDNFIDIAKDMGVDLFKNMSDLIGEEHTMPVVESDLCTHY